MQKSITSERARSGQAILVFLAVSAAAHAAVLIVLPVPAPENAPRRTSSLEVAILQSVTLPVVTPAPRPAASPARRVFRDAPAEAGRDKRVEPTRSALAAPDYEADDGRSLPATGGIPESQRAAPEPKSPTTGEALTQPSLSAAYLSNPRPAYPLASRRAGEQGTVMLRVRVSPDGLATRVAVERSSGSPHLDAAALEAVKAWRFTPARRGGEAIESWMLVPIVFRLDERS